MLSLLELKEKDNVLEIGTGSGWNAALLGYLVKPGKVLTTEIHEELAKKAKEKLKKAGISNVMITLEDFRKIKGRFGKIIFTAGITLEQETIIEDFAKAHLKPKGILLCPFQSGPLIIFKNEKGRLQKNYTNESYNFVPLIL